MQSIMIIVEIMIEFIIEDLNDRRILTSTNSNNDIIQEIKQTWRDGIEQILIERELIQ